MGLRNPPYPQTAPGPGLREARAGRRGRVRLRRADVVKGVPGVVGGDEDGIAIQAHPVRHRLAGALDRDAGRRVKWSSMSHKPSKSLEQIVREVGRYSVDAFLFVQECIGLASDRVHGPLSQEQAALAQWMAREGIGPDELSDRAQAGDLPPDIARAVKSLGGLQRVNRHVTGQQLCEAIREIALERWGLMARNVLTRWNITCTEDIGVIVFALVENGWLQKQPTDRIEDFEHVFSFSEAFDHHYRIGAK